MKTKLTLISTLITGSLLSSGAAMAQADLLDGWSGSASLGAVITAGNSDTRNISGAANVVKEFGAWTHTAFGSIFNAENNDVETANRFDLGYKLDRDIDARTYVFGRLRLDADDFGNIDSRVSAVVGVGRQFFEDDRQAFSGEIGIGANSTEFLSLTPVLSEDALDEFGFPLPDPDQTPLDSLDSDSAILYGSLNYSNILSDNLTFNSVFSFEAGEDNTYTVWDNSLSIRLSEVLSIAVGLLNRTNSDIVGPLGEETDTATRLSIVYSI